MKSMNIAHKHRVTELSYLIPLYSHNSKQHLNVKEETMVSQAEENIIYYKLAKEFIETRLDGEPTQCRVNYLAHVLQAIDDNKCYCSNGCIR